MTKCQCPGAQYIPDDTGKDWAVDFSETTERDQELRTTERVLAG